MGLGRVTSFQLLTQICIQPINKFVSPFSEAPLVLGQTTGDSKLIRLITARTRVKPPTSPILYSLRLLAAPTSKWFFILGLPRRSFEIVSVWTSTTLQGYNYLFKPSIGMRSIANLYISSRNFQQCVTLHLHAPRSGQFPTFSGRESNYQFDSQPFFCHNFCFRCPNS
jgi:hypothetical protein